MRDQTIAPLKLSPDFSYSEIASILRLRDPYFKFRPGCDGKSFRIIWVTLQYFRVPGSTFSL